MLGAMFGLPIGPRPAAKTSTVVGEIAERFPCENCPCGCASADFCWDRCCCHSDAEKLSWAQRNNVIPPAFLVARVKQTIIPVAATLDELPACCRCAAKKAVAKTGPSPTTIVVAKSSVVLLWKAVECRGIESLWVLLSHTVVTGSAKLFPPIPMLIERLLIESDSACSVRQCPDPPVP